MEVYVRPLGEHELDRAGYILRVAFGTFLGVPDPASFAADHEYVRTRWRMNPQAALGAEVDGELVGSNFVTCWGSLGFFGPLTVLPDCWDRGVAQRLIEPTMELFRAWGVRHAGLYTFSNSPKHLALYQKFGFWPRFLTLILEKNVAPANPPPGFALYSSLSDQRRRELLDAFRRLTNSIYEGLDVACEVRAVGEQALGDIVLVEGDSGLESFAVCHCGPWTEAGTGVCYVKFGAVQPGLTAGEAFDRLLDACQALASLRGLSTLVAGINLARHDAYRRMLGRGFRIQGQGLAMHNPNESAYHAPDVYVIEDWR